MDFQIGDPVVHWKYGFGEIVGVEERSLTNEKMLYYVVQIQDISVWVPADSNIMNRLRPPTSKRDFKKLFVILSGPGESLSDDRFERKNQLRKNLEDGKAEAVCQVIRDLTFYEQRKRLNDDDKNIMKRAWSSLCSEWGFSMSVPLAQVENELHSLLKHPVESIAS
jgi:RNA polymerase-interacting CarD/CdnL/TRCF family regulator